MQQNVVQQYDGNYKHLMPRTQTQKSLFFLRAFNCGSFSKASVLGCLSLSEYQTHILGLSISHRASIPTKTPWMSISLRASNPQLGLSIPLRASKPRRCIFLKSMDVYLSQSLKPTNLGCLSLSELQNRGCLSLLNSRMSNPQSFKPTNLGCLSLSEPQTHKPGLSISLSGLPICLYALILKHVILHTVCSKQVAYY